MKHDVLFGNITEQIVEAIKTGEITRWQNPYTNRGLAKNHFTGHVYSGINFILFNFFNKDSVKLYGTPKQISEAGGTLKDGAKERYAVFCSVVFKYNGKTVDAKTAAQLKKEKKRVENFFFYREYKVYSLADTEGINYELEMQSEGNKNEDLDMFIQKTGAEIIHIDQTVGCYYPTIDKINMPNPENMLDNTYYPTIFHELGHWTGAKNRLNREGIVQTIEKGTPKYAFEELVAELTSAFLCAIYGIECIDQSAAYIDFWLHFLEEDKTFIVKAAAAAQKAVDYLMK
jgi:antirestriction protein ArdC